MSGRDRGEVFRGYDGDTGHQRMAGCASWAAFSARWRARQGLPLLWPGQVQYLSPHDFCNGLGHPLPPAEQRRVYRAYLQAAYEQSVQAGARHGMTRRRGLESGDLAMVPAGHFGRGPGGYESDYVYGRADVPPFAPDGLVPARPYGVPSVSRTFHGYWLSAGAQEDEDVGNDAWIGAGEERV